MDLLYNTVVKCQAGIRNLICNILHATCKKILSSHWVCCEKKFEERFEEDEEARQMRRGDFIHGMRKVHECVEFFKSINERQSNALSYDTAAKYRCKLWWSYG